MIIQRYDTPLETPRSTGLEEFLALIAHEVRTPLAVAKNAVTAARTHNGDDDLEEQTELLEMIERNIDLSMLLLDRVNLARDVEDDSVELTRKVLDLAHLVHQTVGDLAAVVLGDHPVEVTGAEELEVEADPTAIREIVFNVLSNAAKYSAPEAPIEVTLEEHVGDARVVVRNHGGGVAPADTERIFEKFYQRDAGSPGVGLGLFISRGLARAHGGDLTVRPAASHGSEFILDLPLHQVRS